MLDPGEIPEPQRLALACATRDGRSAHAALFALDHHLSRIVSSTSEQLLGQMRLTWWRDELAKQPQDRPSGDAVLNMLSDHWHGHEEALLNLVDGWEALLLASDSDQNSLLAFANGRASAFVRLASSLGASTSSGMIHDAAMCWALVDLAGHSSTHQQQQDALSLAGTFAAKGFRLDRSMRPLAMLAGLSKRALRKKAPPQLLGDRFSPIIALRLGLFGR